MSHIRKALLVIFLLSIAAPVTAQGIDKVVKPRKKQSTAFYLKVQYCSPEFNVISSIKDDINRAHAMGVMSKSALGLSLRIPIWHVIYIQPELFYSIQTNWDSASLQSGFLRQTFYAFKHRECSYFDIPVNIGVRWEPAKLFAARAFFGPMIRMQLAQGKFSLYENYFMRVGIGLDLLNFLTLEAGYGVEMNKLTIFDETNYYFFGVGLKL